MQKFFTLVVVPQKTSNVKKIKIPINILVPVVLLILALLGGLGIVFFDYFSIRSQIIDLEQAQGEYQRYEDAIERFYKTYGDLELHQNHIKSLNNKLRVLTRLETQKKQKVGVGALDIESIRKAQKEGVLSVIASDSASLNENQNEREMQFKNLVQFFTQNSNPISRIPYGWPVKGFLMTDFGLRADPLTGQSRSHFGINIATSTFSKVKATADGIVVFAGNDDTYNKVLILDHGNGLQTKYAHISSFEVEEGELVRNGEEIAQVGATGQTAGPHLYYEVIFNRIHQNPVSYIDHDMMKN